MNTRNVIFNPITNTKEITEIYINKKPLEELKEEKNLLIMELYKNTITKGMISSSTGEEVTYGYSPQDQLNYSKWANTLALDPTKESVTIGSVSHGVLTLTREQFLQFTRDCEKHEMGLYMKRVELQDRIRNATTIEELESIPMSME